MIKKSSSSNSIMTAFKAFDTNGDGQISRDELKKAMESMGQNMTDAQIDQMIASCDKNHDGKVNYKEFAKMMGSK